ncbi:outer membrane protein assembly factor BamE [Sphingomicrobium lutaoense]|uniref:Outer membrane protein assembly factor BamE (Lipoprotein component of BamABCDE complex) n=1 Tax=Sphingomicrobium lutaoense TaxID=515949 RepID=A0A839Z2R9_9SPHN|nr:outer membrane protein assembly factor BamE [Sphingomicrobium lutaoense]MBB3764848.1 outer membrane protein assembly factor BamE (lipoprotein component of BamABCDE complex) [Sphingomicrobium lutaoense]
MRLKLMITLAAATALAGCAGIRDQSGYIASEELVQAIEPGIDNKESVQATLGRPTFTGQFDDNQWYYVSRQTSQFAFRRPRVTDARVLAISFDAQGNVVSVNETGEELAINITPNGDETPTLGRERSFFEELFGGIGQVGGLGPGGPGGGGPR